MSSQMRPAPMTERAMLFINRRALHRGKILLHEARIYMQYAELLLLGSSSLSSRSQ